jgi:hypothetical protein
VKSPHARNLTSTAAAKPNENAASFWSWIKIFQPPMDTDGHRWTPMDTDKKLNNQAAKTQRL